MADLKNYFADKSEAVDEVEVEEVEVVADPVVVEPVVAPQPVAPRPVAVQAKADEWEVAPGIWQIVTPVTGAFTLPDGTWVRPTESDGVSRAAVPSKWVEYVRSLKG